MQNSDYWSRITSFYGSQTSPVFLCIQNSEISIRNTTLCGFQASPVVFAYKSDFWTRITSFYGSQTSPDNLCMHNNVISTRITSLYWSQPSSVVYACKIATFGPELKVSMGPRPHLLFWAHVTVCLAQEYQDYMGSSRHLWFCACKTATLEPELQISVGPRPHLWFFHAKQRLLDQNNKSLWVPDMTCRFVHVQQRG